MYFRIDNDTVVREGGTWIRRSPNSEAWAEYEAWVAKGNIARAKPTRAEWGAMHPNARRRLRELKP